MAVAVALSFAQGWVFAAVLEPEGYGLFALVSTAASLGSLVQLGMLSGLTRELPVMIGGRQLTRADSLVRSTTSAMIMITLGGALVVGLTVVLYSGGTGEFREATSLTAGWVASRLFAELALLRLRSESASLLFPVVIVTQRIVSLTLGSFAAELFGFAGLVGVYLVSDLSTYLGLTLLYLRRVNAGSPRMADVRYLIAIGLPQAVAGVLRFGQLSGEKFFILWRGDAALVGVYQIAWWPLGAAITLNGVVNQFLAPRLLRDLGRHQSVEAVFKQSMRASGMILLAGIIAGIPLVVVLGPLIRWLLPEYIDAVPAARIFIVGAILTIANLSHIGILAANRPDLLLKTQMISSALTMAAYAVVTSLTLSLSWIATVSLLSVATDFAMRLAVAQRLSKQAG